MIDELDALIALVTGGVPSLPRLSADFEKGFDAARAKYATTVPGNTAAQVRIAYPKLFALTAVSLFEQATRLADQWLRLALSRLPTGGAAPSPCVAGYLKQHFAATTLAEQQRAVRDISAFLLGVSTGPHGLHDASVTYTWNGTWCGDDAGAYTGNGETQETVFCPAFFVKHVLPEFEQTPSLTKALIHETLHRQNPERFRASSIFSGELYEPPLDPADEKSAELLKKYEQATLDDHLKSADSFAAFARDVATRCA